MYNMRFLNTSDNFNKAWHTQVDIESSTENEQYIPEKKKRRLQIHPQMIVTMVCVMNYFFFEEISLLCINYNRFYNYF